MWVLPTIGQLLPTATCGVLNQGVCHVLLVPLLLTVLRIIWNLGSPAFALPLVGGRGTHRRLSFSVTALCCALAFVGVAAEQEGRAAEYRDSGCLYRQLETGQRLSSENFTRWEPSAEEGGSTEASNNVYNDNQIKVENTKPRLVFVFLFLWFVRLNSIFQS